MLGLAVWTHCGDQPGVRRRGDIERVSDLFSGFLEVALKVLSPESEAHAMTLVAQVQELGSSPVDTHNPNARSVILP